MTTPTANDRFPDSGPRQVYGVRGAEQDVVSGLLATLELAPVGIAHFSDDGRFLLVNSKLCAMLGYAREDLLTIRFDEITFPEDRQACVSANARLAAGEVESYEVEKRFIRRDGSAVWARVTVSAVRNGSGKVAFFVGVAEDITEQKKYLEARAAEHELTERLLALEQDARARAERANRMRDDVLAVVAHDLRSPLHTFQLSAAAMAEPAMTNEARAQQADIIHRAVENMDRLIGELLDIGRIESGSFPITRSPVLLADLLEEAMAMFRPLAEENAIHLTRDDACDPGTVLCDRDQLMRVFSNLIGNAVKFTPAGGRVSVHASRSVDAVEISVRDTGPGIPPDDLAHVFDRFWQSDRTQRFGTGLGLVIAKGIVESHGGSIWAESTVGRGSCFHFTVPVQ